jgi:hypothetical protein
MQACASSARMQDTQLNAACATTACMQDMSLRHSAQQFALRNPYTHTLDPLSHPDKPFSAAEYNLWSHA